MRPYVSDSHKLSDGPQLTGCLQVSNSLTDTWAANAVASGPGLRASNTLASGLDLRVEPSPLPPPVEPPLGKVALRQQPVLGKTANMTWLRPGHRRNSPPPLVTASLPQGTDKSLSPRITRRTACPRAVIFVLPLRGVYTKHRPQRCNHTRTLSHSIWLHLHQLHGEAHTKQEGTRRRATCSLRSLASCTTRNTQASTLIHIFPSSPLVVDHRH